MAETTERPAEGDIRQHGRLHPLVALKNYWALKVKNINPEDLKDPTFVGWFAEFRKWCDSLGEPQEQREWAKLAAEELGCELEPETNAVESEPGSDS